MNLTIGCREKTSKGWIYRLNIGGQAMSEKAWLTMVEKAKKLQGHQAVFEQILAQEEAKTTKGEQVPYTVAMWRYAAKYCVNVNGLEATTKQESGLSKVSEKSDLYGGLTGQLSF
jgi:hypothetical protein